MTVKTIIICDPASNDVDADIAEVTRQLSDVLDIEVVASGIGMHAATKPADLLVIDYGGMSAWGGSDTGAYQIRKALEWAAEHPGKLLLLWTDHTRFIFEAELQAEFGGLENVMMHYNPKVEDMWDQLDDFERELGRWFADSVRKHEPMPTLVTPGRQ